MSRTLVIDGITYIRSRDAARTVSGIDDRSIIAILVSAVQEITKITGTFKANLIAWLADAQNGIQDLFAKNIYATNITADHGYFGTVSASSTVAEHTLTNELCVNDDAGVPVCVTGTQLRSLLSGSVLGASTQHQEEAAADAATAPSGESTGAPAATPAPNGVNSTDPASATPAVDGSPGASEATSTSPETAPTAEEVPTPGPATANDNSPISPLSATGTDGTTTAQ